MDEDSIASNEAILSAIQALQRRVDSATKKPDLTPNPSFKNEGNRQQFEVTARVITLIEEAIKALDTDLDISGAKTHLNSAIRELKTRQKHIKIADRSPHGWQTVKEYTQDELADDSGDEKRIKKVIC